MLISHEREKLIHAINFFARNTKKLGKVKLFKLLYFLDFEHFKQTGRSVTGLTYNAWPMGPVPVSLSDELDAPRLDLSESMKIDKIQIKDKWMMTFSPTVPFSDTHFTKREMMILKNLAEEYRDADAESMIEATHLENLPWDKIYNKEGKKQQEIPYDLAVSGDGRDVLMAIANARVELMRKLG